MNPLPVLRIAVRALGRNKVRSFLTTLGIIIGVFAVIAMVAIGEGAKARVEAQFSSLGSNMLILVPGASGRGGAMGGAGSMPSLTWDDLGAVRSEVPGVLAAAAVLRSSAQVQSEDQNWTTSVYGTSSDYFEMRSWAVAQGAGFADSDLDTGAKVAVLGATVVKKLYGNSGDPIGQTVRIRNVPFVVIGVLESKGQSAMGQDNDDAVFIPERTWLAKVQGGLQKFIPGIVMVRMTSPEASKRAESQLSALLRDRHRIEPGGEDDFSVRNLSEMTAAVEASTRTMSALLASVAAVSLLVGGIGIMNIMLVSVTERTREIGLRMAVGAKPRDVLAQFLTEALLLSLAGGAIGILGGVGLTHLLAARFGWSVIIRPAVLLVSVGFSAIVGVGFGLYPAQKAARLDPIDALRYE